MASTNEDIVMTSPKQQNDDDDNSATETTGPGGKVNSVATVLASTTRARTLTVSDQHANILLTVDDDSSKKKKDDDDGDEVDSPSSKPGLLKLTLVPFHKADLACLPPDAAKEEEGVQKDTTEEEEAKKEKELLREKEETDHSARVLGFLSRFGWRMTSESGAEYSFHEAFPKSSSIISGNGDDDEETMKERGSKRCKTEVVTTEGGEKNEEEKNEEEKNDTITKAGSTRAAATGAAVFNAELVYPASERQVRRAMPSPGFAMVSETPEMYEAVTKPYIESVVGSGSLSWIKNIVETKKEKERLLLNADGWILNVDTKWRTHPDCFSSERSEWHKHESTADLYCLGIIKEDGVASLRDLTADHLPVLRDMVERGPRVIREVYGVPPDQLRVFVHYQPQFYHFHVHYTRLENDTGVQAEKAHLLSDIIQDLETDPDYYKKRTITYKLSLKDNLYQKLVAGGAAAFDNNITDAK